MDVKTSLLFKNGNVPVLLIREKPNKEMKMNNREQYIEEQKEYHISLWLHNELGYTDDQIDEFWETIGAKVDNDLQ